MENYQISEPVSAVRQPRKRLAWFVASLSIVASLLAHTLLIAVPQTAAAQEQKQATCTPVELPNLATHNLSVHPSGVSESLETVYYEVQGDSARTWRNQLLDCSPVPITNGVAMVQSQISYAFSYRSSDSQTCSVSQAKVGLTQRLVIPRLTDDSTPSSQWTEFYNALDDHEQGHIERNQQYAAIMHQQLQDLSSDCNIIEQTVKLLMSQLQTKLNNSNIDYDRHTKHGHTQGVRL